MSDYEGEYWSSHGGNRMGIKAGVPFIIDIPIDDNHWYALNYYKGKFWEILHKCAALDDKMILRERLSALPHTNSGKGYKLLKEFNRDLIERCYSSLLDYAEQACSRYAFQALGSFLMEYGVNISDHTKRLIIKNSHWRDEYYNFDDRNSRIERKKVLLNFIIEILNYRNREI